jgi:hypothetical protein
MQDVESWTETNIKNIEKSFKNNEIHRVLIEVLVEERAHYDSGYEATIDEINSIQAEYTVDGEFLTLSGFYPSANETGRDLYRENLECLKALKGAHNELADRFGDEYGIEPFDVTIMDIL